LRSELEDFRNLLLFILTANGFLPGGSGNTIRHNKQITHITQNNIAIKRNTAHKTTHTKKDTLHRMNKNNHHYNTNIHHYNTKNHHYVITLIIIIIIIIITYTTHADTTIITVITRNISIGQ
jgi:hypothetical protein